MITTLQRLSIAVTIVKSKRIMAMNDKYTEEHQLENAHRELAKDLRKICYPNGTEIRPERSAIVIYELGRVQQKLGNFYHECNDTLKKQKAKLAWMRSAVLYNAAIIRKPANAEEVKTKLQEMCQDLIRKAGKDGFETSKETDLVEAAKRALENAQTMRKKAGQNLDFEAWKNIQGIRRVNKIKSLQEDITMDYTNIMRQVMDYSVHAMGNAPCKYALAGMGSLARMEVTPYSDFESIILLEDGVENNEDYEKILEYWRWVATFFQVILVNMGETIIRFAYIPYLNDEDDDWFHDNSPCGISPDGFSPHACKNPLGRIEWTENKPWSTELIKPVGEMLEYLQGEKAEKNGYFLDDILTKTCFVAGDEAIQVDFQEQVTKHQRANKKQATRVIAQDLENLNLTKMFESSFTNDYNIKRLLYRTMSQYMSALGFLLGLKAVTPLGIAQELLDPLTTSISKGSAEKILQTVALVYETRLRLYLQSEGEADIVTTQNEKSGFHFKATNQGGKAEERITNEIPMSTIVESFKTVEKLGELVQMLLDPLKPQGGGIAVEEMLGIRRELLDYYRYRLTRIHVAEELLYENIGFQNLLLGNIDDAQKNFGLRFMHAQEVTMASVVPYLALSMFTGKKDEVLADFRERDNKITADVRKKIYTFCQKMYDSLHLIQDILNPSELNQPAIHSKAEEFKQFITDFLDEIKMPVRVNVTEPSETFHGKVQTVLQTVLDCHLYVIGEIDNFRGKEWLSLLGYVKKMLEFYQLDVVEMPHLDAIDNLMQVMRNFEIELMVGNITTSPISQQLKVAFENGTGMKVNSDIMHQLLFMCQFAVDQNMRIKLFKLLEVLASCFQSKYVDVVCDCRHGIGNSFKRLGKYADALLYFKRELHYRQQVFPEADETIKRCEALIAECKAP